jgi:peptide deformylase
MEHWVFNLADDMWMTMLMARAVGLAANQVGMDYRLITVKGDQFEGPMINPSIVEKSQEVFHYQEGCLSAPGYAFDTGKRSKSIRVNYFDLEGKPQEVSLTDMTAVIVQHEIDHLEGIIFMDYLDQRLHGK